MSLLGGALAVVAGSAISGLIGAKGAKGAAETEVKGLEESQRLIREAAEAAAEEIKPLFRQAQRDAQAGFQAGLGVIGEAVPEQIKAFQAGNVGAQRTAIAGLDPFRQAILGLPIDTSGIQPLEIPVDTSFLQQDIPVTPPPSEEALRFQKLVESLRRDPVGTRQFFENIAGQRQQSIEQDVPLGEITDPQVTQAGSPFQIGRRTGGGL